MAKKTTRKKATTRKDEAKNGEGSTVELTAGVRVVHKPGRGDKPFGLVARRGGSPVWLAADDLHDLGEALVAEAVTRR